MQGIFDSHAHYNDERFAEDRDTLLPQIHSNGVSHILNAGCDIPSSMEGIRLAEQYPYVYTSVGIHPEEADHIPENYLDTLAQLAKHPKVVAIGEIGLDYHYENANTAVQHEIFRQQLDLADQLDLPVIIHSRDATQDTTFIYLSYPVFVYFNYFPIIGNKSVDLHFNVGGLCIDGCRKPFADHLIQHVGILAVFVRNFF